MQDSQDGRWNMQVTFPGDKKVDARFKGFNVKTDQPVDEGGDGTAPEPYDLFVASIGTCAGILVLSFCRRKALDTEGIRLEVNWSKDAQSRLIDRIDILIKLPPHFPKKYKRALEKAAGVCPVKRSLEEPPQFNIQSIFEH